MDETTIDQTPPPGFIPQTPLDDDQVNEIHERDTDLINDAELEVPDADPSEGEAADGDDIAND